MLFRRRGSSGQRVLRRNRRVYRPPRVVCGRTGRPIVCGQDKGVSVERGDPCLCASRESLRRSNKSVRRGSCCCCVHPLCPLQTYPPPRVRLFAGCSPGRFQPVEGAPSASSLCRDCPEAWFQDSNRSVDCERCPVGSFLAFEGASDSRNCTVCDDNSSTCSLLAHGNIGFCNLSGPLDTYAQQPGQNASFPGTDMAIAPLDIWADASCSQVTARSCSGAAPSDLCSEFEFLAGHPNGDAVELRMANVNTTSSPKWLVAEVHAESVGTGAPILGLDFATQSSIIDDSTSFVACLPRSLSACLPCSERKASSPRAQSVVARVQLYESMCTCAAHLREMSANSAPLETLLCSVQYA